MKNSTLVTSIVIILIVGAALWIASGNSNKPDKEGLPPSLGQYYESKPSVYLIKMFELGEAMMGIGVHIKQGDMENAKKSYNDFSKKYEESSNLVPEWKKYYDLKLAEKIGSSLDSGNVPAVFEDLEKMGASCGGCHMEKMTPVWARYNWNDFNKISMNTPEPTEPVLPYPAAKMKYLVPAFDGIGVNIKNDNQKAAQESFVLFRTMFDNLNSTCSTCHVSERKYYVSEDIRGMITAMGEKIDSGDLAGAEGLRKGIGMESCYACHVLHMPAQFAKASKK